VVGAHAGARFDADRSTPLALGRGAQVDDGDDAELVDQPADVGLSGAVKRIAAEQPPPAHRAPLGSSIATEVAEVVTALEDDGPFHVRHYRTGRERVPKNDIASGRCGSASTSTCATRPRGRGRGPTSTPAAST